MCVKAGGGCDDATALSYPWRSRLSSDRDHAFHPTPLIRFDMYTHIPTNQQTNQGNNDMLNLTSKKTLDAKMRVKSDIFAGWEEEVDHQVRGCVGA